MASKMAAKELRCYCFCFLYICIFEIGMSEIANVRFLYIINNFEIFSTVKSSIASKMAAKFSLQFFLNKYIHFGY